MDAPAVLYALRWLIHDTFRQTLTSRVFWILSGLNALAIIFCLGVSVEGGALVENRELIDPKTNKLIGPEAKGPAGHVSLMFGAMTYTFNRKADNEVQFLLSIFASWIAGTLGIVMALVWTAGFVPDSLQPSAASVLLAKPAPRWLFLTGKFLGVICFIAVHVAIFFVGTWLALGLRTGYWAPAYLMGIPLMIFHFAVMFSFSVMLAVLFRSTMACVVGGVLFWIICYAINYGRHFAVVYPELNDGHTLPAFTMFLSDLSYWLLPKPADFTLMLEQSLNLGEAKITMASQAPFQQMLAKDMFHPLLAIFTSCLFPVFSLWAAASQLSKTDY